MRNLPPRAPTHGRLGDGANVSTSRPANPQASRIRSGRPSAGDPDASTAVPGACAAAFGRESILRRGGPALPPPPSQYTARRPKRGDRVRRLPALTILAAALVAGGPAAAQEPGPLPAWAASIEAGLADAKSKGQALMVAL